MPTSKTLTQFISQVRNYLSETTAASSFWTDAFLKEIFNECYLLRCGDLIAAYEGWFTGVQVYNIVANVDTYAWPDNFERLQKLSIVRSDGRSFPLRRFERHEGVNVTAVQGDDSYFPNFRPVRTGFKLEPAPKSGASTFAELFEDFETVGDWTTNADGTETLNEVNFRTGTASLSLTKDAIAGDTVTAVKTLATKFDLSGQTLELDVYIPSTIDLTSIVIRFTDGAGSPATGDVTLSGLQTGWKTYTLDIDAITDVWDDTDVDTVTIIITWGNNNTRPEGFLFDNMNISSQSVTGNLSNISKLSLEYVATPREFSSGDITALLDPEFPVTFAPLLVYDTVVGALDAEQLLEGGNATTILRRKNEWELRWERYIDNRIVLGQEIVPFVGPYDDA